MKSQTEDTSHWKQIAAKDIKKRTRDELYRTIEFDGATMHDKALAKAELASRDFWGRMKLMAAGSLLGVVLTTIAGLLVRW